MTELRERLADALRQHRGFPAVCICGWEVSEGWKSTSEKHAHHLADVLLSLPGVAIVALPTKSWPHNHGLSFGTDVMTYRDRVLVGTDLDMSRDYARALAAALLAAANAAEAQP